MKPFVRFLRFLFYRDPREVVVRRLEKVREGAEEPSWKGIVAVLVSATMAVVLLGSFAGILWLTVVQRAEAPPILREIFVGTMGYFGGALVAFLKGGA